MAIFIGACISIVLFLHLYKSNSFFLFLGVYNFLVYNSSLTTALKYWEPKMINSIEDKKIAIVYVQTNTKIAPQQVNLGEL